MRMPYILVTSILVVIFGGVFGAYAFKMKMIKNYFASFTPPPEVVSAVQAESQNWQPILPAVGKIYAFKGVDISSEVSGKIKAIYFNPGETVTAGQKLIQLDDSAENAQLKSMEAQFHLAEKNLERNQRLFSVKAISQSAFDDAQTNYKQLKGSYDNLLSLKQKKLLIAPFTGRIGVNQVKVGQFINAGQLCTNLQTNDSLYVSFSVSQKDFAKISKGIPVELSVDTYPDLKFKGKIYAIDSKIDDDTHTLEVRANIEDTNGKLISGMYADAKVLLPAVPNTIVVPQTAVIYTLYGESAFVVELLKEEKEPAKIAQDKNGFQLGKVKRVFVRTGEKQGNSTVVLEGIKVGDLVVNSGQIKLEDGSRVAINNNTKL